jgi:cell division septation protein DedD
MLQFSEVGETEALPAMSPFAMRNENLVVNRSTVRGNPVVEPAVSSRAPTPQPVVPMPQPPTVVPMPPTVAPMPPPPMPQPVAKPELPSMVYLLLGLNAITIALCLTLILARR